MGVTMLEMTTSEKDFGMFIDEELQFHQHDPRAVNKAPGILGLVRVIHV